MDRKNQFIGRKKAVEDEILRATYRFLKEHGNTVFYGQTRDELGWWTADSIYIDSRYRRLISTKTWQYKFGLLGDFTIFQALESLCSMGLVEKNNPHGESHELLFGIILRDTKFKFID